MKRYSAILLVFVGLLLCGCGKKTDISEAGNATEISERTNGEESRTETSQMENGEEESGSELQESGTLNDGAGVRIVQGGPYGEISIEIPEDWKFETCPIDGDVFRDGWYGVRFWPESAAEGYVDVVAVYAGSFGVCGTGLATEKQVIAGKSANVGTYDDHAYWDFIHFQDEYEGVIALTSFVESWWGEYQSQAMEILDTLSFQPEIREGGFYVHTEESEINEIGLQFSVMKINSTGAMLVWNQYNADAPTGELMFGADFVIEVYKDGNWEQASIVVEGDYGFTAEAYNINLGETRELEISWEWLYGALAPGEYRIGKEVNDFRKTGDYDTYTAYAHFILN